MWKIFAVPTPDTLCYRDFALLNSPATFYKWKRDIAIEQDEDKRRLKQLEKENARLKKMYAELMIDHEILQEGYEMAKKIVARDKGRKW